MRSPLRSSIASLLAVALLLLAGTPAPASDIAPAVTKEWLSSLRWRSIGPANMAGRSCKNSSANCGSDKRHPKARLGETHKARA